MLARFKPGELKVPTSTSVENVPVPDPQPTCHHNQISLYRSSKSVIHSQSCIFLADINTYLLACRWCTPQMSHTSSDRWG